MHSSQNCAFSSLPTFISSSLSFPFVSHILPSPSPPPCLPLFPPFVVFAFLAPFQDSPFSPFLFHHSLLAVRCFSLFLSTFFLLSSLPRECPEDKKRTLCRIICIFHRLHPYHSLLYKQQFPFMIPYKFSQDWHLSIKESTITSFLWKVWHICSACQQRIYYLDANLLSLYETSVAVEALSMQVVKN